MSNNKPTTHTPATGWSLNQEAHRREVIRQAFHYYPHLFDELIEIGKVEDHEAQTESFFAWVEDHGFSHFGDSILIRQLVRVARFGKEAVLNEMKPDRWGSELRDWPEDIEHFHPPHWDVRLQSAGSYREQVMNELESYQERVQKSLSLAGWKLERVANFKAKYYLWTALATIRPRKNAPPLSFKEIAGLNDGEGDDEGAIAKSVAKVRKAINDPSTKEIENDTTRQG